MKKILILTLLISGFALSSPLVYTHELDTTLVYEGLGSNSVTDIVQMNDSTFLFASGNGLSISYDRGETIRTFYGSGESVAFGAVTGIITLGEHIWVSTAYDTMILEGSYYSDYPVGNGVSYSPDMGLTWQRFPQSVDDVYDTTVHIYSDSIPSLPITSRINNITYDLDIQVTQAGDTVLWSANFAGGCRKSYDKGATWERVVLPPDYYDELDHDTALDFTLSPTTGALGYENNLNHRVFSLSIKGDTVAVGTANGINISYDEGETWIKFDSQNSAVCGDFIVDLIQSNNGTIYAVALPTTSSETRGVVISQRNTNGMLYWETQLEGQRLYDVFAHRGEYAYSSGEEGLWYSPDGWNWTNMGNIQDVNGQLLLTHKVQCSLEDGRGVLWIGTQDGVAFSEDNGINWEFIRRVSGVYAEDLALSAYPSPFSPTRMNQLNDEGYVRIHCKLPASGRVSVDIYDFSMTRVKNIAENVTVSSDHVEFLWNGKNGLNNLVANGVYFIRLEYDWGDGDGKQVAWTKLMILD